MEARAGKNTRVPEKQQIFMFLLLKILEDADSTFFCENSWWLRVNCKRWRHFLLDFSNGNPKRYLAIYWCIGDWDGIQNISKLLHPDGAIPKTILLCLKSCAWGVWNPEMYSSRSTQKCEANHHLLDELGSLSHYLPVFFYISGGCLGFLPSRGWSQISSLYPRQKAEKLRMRCVGLARLARDQPFFDPRNHPILKCELCEGIHFRVLKAWDATLGHCDLQG